MEALESARQAEAARAAAVVLEAREGLSKVPLGPRFRPEVRKMYAPGAHSRLQRHNGPVPP